MSVDKGRKAKHPATFTQPDGSIILDITTPEPVALFVKGGAGKFNGPVASARSMAQLLICWLESETDEPVLVESLRRSPQDAKISLQSFKRRLTELKRFGIAVEPEQGIGVGYVRAKLPEDCFVVCRHKPGGDPPAPASVDTPLARGTLTTREFLRRHGLVAPNAPSAPVPMSSHVGLLLAIREIFVPDVAKDKRLRPIHKSTLVADHAISSKNGSSPCNPFADTLAPNGTISADPQLDTPPRDINETLRMLAQEKRARARRDFERCEKLNDLLNSAAPVDESSVGISTHSTAVRAERTRIGLAASQEGAIFLASCWDKYLQYRNLYPVDPSVLVQVKKDLGIFLAQETYGSQSQRYDAINLLACIRRVEAMVELENLRRTGTSAANGQDPAWLDGWLNLVESLERDQMVTIQEAMLANSPEHVQARLTNYGITLYQLAEEVRLHALAERGQVLPSIIAKCALRIELATEALYMAAAMRSSVAQRKGDHLNEICFISSTRVWLQFLGAERRSAAGGFALEMAQQLVSSAESIIQEIRSEKSVADAAGAVIDLADEVLRLQALFPGRGLGASQNWKSTAAGSGVNEYQLTRGSRAREEREAWEATLRRLGLLA